MPTSDQNQKLAEMKAAVEKSEMENLDFEKKIQEAAEQRKERGNRMTALSWMRTLLFPFIEERASAYNTTILEATEKIVHDKTRIDLLLRDNWNSPELQAIMDQGPAKMLLAGAGSLLNDSDEKTIEGAKWLLHYVLPEDPEGTDIAQAYIKDEKLWVDTIVGIKHLFASRLSRPRSQPAIPTRTF